MTETLTFETLGGLVFFLFVEGVGKGLFEELGCLDGVLHC